MAHLEEKHVDNGPACREGVLQPDRECFYSRVASAIPESLVTEACQLASRSEDYSDDIRARGTRAAVE